MTRRCTRSMPCRTLWTARPAIACRCRGGIQAVVRVGAGWDTAAGWRTAHLWAVQQRGLPPLPAAPRRSTSRCSSPWPPTRPDPRPAKGGWYHAMVPGRGEIAAASLPITPRPSGGSPAMCRRRRSCCRRRSRGEPRQLLCDRPGRRLAAHGQRHGRRPDPSQQPDGSYRYDGPYRRGHFEDTASGICSRPAYRCWSTPADGQPESLAAALKTLEYMKRFRTPRGAQTWEVPLHTPDILASGHPVWAYVRAYQLTGDRGHLAEARRWAITGLPFVYQWSNRPIMMYATTPVFGATNWKAPNWIGLPVQWCGTVYAYGLLLLAPHDDTLDWKQVAEGILVCGEQMQYPDGPSMAACRTFLNWRARAAGRRHQSRALVSLRLLLAGNWTAWPSPQTETIASSPRSL